MTLRFDHAVILANDLNTAIQDYQTLGFNVFFGGEHAGGKTHNALIVFADGSYLELLAPTKPELLESVDPNDRTNFLFMFQYGEGFGGYALLSQDLAADTAAMQSRGLEVQLRPPGGRARPDGQELRWHSSMINGSMTPFFIQDDTPRVLRVPDDADKIYQPNGVTGVSELKVAVMNVEAGIRRYEAIFGIPANRGAASFQLNGFTIQLVLAGVNEDRLAGIVLAGDKKQILDITLTHGAAMEIVG